MTTPYLTPEATALLNSIPNDAPEWTHHIKAPLNLSMFTRKTSRDDGQFMHNYDSIYFGNTGLILEIECLEQKPEDKSYTMHFTPNSHVSADEVPENERAQNVFTFAVAIDTLVNWYLDEGNKNYSGFKSLTIKTNPDLIKVMQRFFSEYNGVFSTQLTADFVDKGLDYEFESSIDLELLSAKYFDSKKTNLNIFAQRVKDQIMRGEVNIVQNPLLFLVYDREGRECYAGF